MYVVNAHVGGNKWIWRRRQGKKGMLRLIPRTFNGSKNSSSLIFLPHLMRPHIYNNQFRFDLMERREKNFRFTENKLFFSSLRKRLYIIKLSTVFNWEQESKKVRRKWHLSTFLLSLRNFLFAQISLRIWFMAMPIKRWESSIFLHKMELKTWLLILEASSLIKLNNSQRRRELIRFSLFVNFYFHKLIQVVVMMEKHTSSTLDSLSKFNSTQSVLFWSTESRVNKVCDLKIRYDEDIPQPIVRTTLI